MARRTRTYETNLTVTQTDKPPKDSAGSVLRRNNAVLPAKHVDDDRYLACLVGAAPTAEPFRHGEYLHASDVIHKCSRMIAIANRHNIKLTLQPLPESAGLTFAMGRAIESHVREKVKRNAPTKLWGGWKCPCGHTEFQGTYAEARSQNRCKRCHGPLGEYQELVLTHEELGVSGSIDLTLLEGRALHLNEIKSIKHDAWKELSRPVPEHLVQILFYWWLAKEQGIDVYDSVSILYCTKGYVMFGSPYKEFVMQPSKLIRRLDDYLDEARAIKAAASGGKLPVRTCMKIDQGEAKTCPMATMCFQMRD